MTRLIDADAVEKITWEDPHYYDPLNVLTEVREKVRALPTVDAVPVTRCRDCRHYTGKWCTIYSTKQFDINDIYKGADDFCSQAERKEE